MSSLKQIILPYNQNATQFMEQYESCDFLEVHSGIDELLPISPGCILDIGAGSGRDAAWFAEKGHEVVAVEPAEKLRVLANERHQNAKIRWMNDALPALSNVLRTGLTFDLIWLSAVWMHIAPRDRQRSFRKMVTLLRPGGKIMLSLRNGPIPKERIMFHSSGEEVERLARRFGLAVVHQVNGRDKLGRDKITWKSFVLQLPDDGQGALPLLRHVILNDSKSSTYKLALLRILVRIADSATGMARDLDDDSVGLPLGLVALYWIRSFKPLVENNIPQKPNNNRGTGLGFVKQGFNELRQESPFNLRIGVRFTGTRAKALRDALRDAKNTIVQMPAHHITYPNQNQPVFPCDNGRVPRNDAFTLDRAYLESFGTLRVPRNLWLAMSRYAAWIEPTLINEWVELMQGYTPENNLLRLDYHKLLRWLDPEHDTKIARQRVEELRNAGKPVYCLWSKRRLHDNFAIDHCLPFAAWPCNDLWNLFPSNPRVNSQKKDRLPDPESLFRARPRIFEWWETAWQNTQLGERFIDEAQAALPATTVQQNCSLEDIFDGLMMQRAVLKRNQQLKEWRC